MSNPRAILAPTTYERVLALLSGLLGLTVIAAILRGQPHWHDASPQIWAHLLTVLLAVALTPAMLLMTRGTLRHRQLGMVWMGMMFATAIISLFVKVIHPGHFSPIHIFSVITIIGVPRALWLARRRRIAEHRATIRNMITGALLIAGWLTFPFGRMLGQWLFGA